MRDDVRRLIGELTSALRTQIRYYAELDEALQRLRQSLGPRGNAGGSTVNSKSRDTNVAGEGIDQIISTQQQAFARVQDGDQEIQSLRSELGKVLGISGEVTLTRIQEAVGGRSDRGALSALIENLQSEINHLTASIERVQESVVQNESLLKRQMNRLNAEFDKVKKGHRVSEAYKRMASGAPNPSAFLDKRS